MSASDESRPKPMSALGRKRTLIVQARTAKVGPMNRWHASKNLIHTAARDYYYAREVGTG
jgi:hypothetical protein